MVTIRYIAKECGVSIATVSNVLNGKKNVSEEMRAKVMAKVQELNYTPNSVAKNLKTKRTRILGVIVEDITIFSVPDVVDGITECCENNNYGVTLVNLRLFQKFNDAYYSWVIDQEQLQEKLQELMAAQVEAIIYISAHERTLQCLPKNFPIPLIMCYAYSKTEGIPSVLVEEEGPTQELLQHAISLGHRKIGVITGKPDSAHMQERLRAYQNTLFQNGILYDPALVCIGDWNRETGYQHTDELLRRGVTLIFCMNDPMAAGVYDRLRELGLEVGKDISVMGYDNRPLSQFLNPPLTTVNLPLHDMGYRCGETALEAIRSGGTGELTAEIHVPGQVILRASLGKLNSDN